MNGKMKQMKLDRMRLPMAVCSLVMVVTLAQIGLAQQAVGKSPASQQQSGMLASAAEPVASAFAPASFSALMARVAADRPAAKPAVEQEEESSKSSQPGNEGIKIHGHWVLQVKNPDGTLGERREFNNSLITTNTPGSSSSGSAVLAAILSGNVTVADPAIGILTGTLTGDASTYCFIPTVNVGCYVFTDSGSFWNPMFLLVLPGATTGILGGQLGMSKTATFTPTASIGMTGNFTVPAGLTSISGVQSLYSGCISQTFVTSNSALSSMQGVTGFGSADHGSSTCISAANSTTGIAPFIGTDYQWSGALTSAALPGGPMTVTPGQILSITFTLSFS
jgi:hypothetical protein